VKSSAATSDEDGDEDDDDGGPYQAHNPNKEALSQLCDDTTIGEACEGSGVPRCPFLDSGQGGDGLAVTDEAHEAHEEA
jgi:hypothetical protein